MEDRIARDFSEMNGKVLAATARTCEWVLKTGHARAGHNGPYANPETPVRNTAYWLMGFSYAYQSCGDKRFFAAAKTCADYLVGEENRPGGGAFSCIKTGGEKWSGLIGQAWVLDALCEIYGVTGDERYVKIAKEVFLMHEFDSARGLWKKLGINGEVLGVDAIVHHQLWFAAAGAVLANATGDKEIRARIDRFLEHMDRNLLVYGSGLIMQRILPPMKGTSALRPVHQGLGYLKRAVVNPIMGRGLRYKENGYHAYNLYAFAMLKNEGFAEDFFRSRRFMRVLTYAFSNEILESFEKANHSKDSTGPALEIGMPVNRYAYPYNAPGFAMPYIYYTFCDLLPGQAVDAVKRAVQKQLTITYSEEEGRFSKNTEDAETLNARAYQFMRCVTLFGSVD